MLPYSLKKGGNNMMTEYMKLENLHRAIDWMYSHNLELLPEGKTVIDSDIFVSVSSFTTKESNSYEAHRIFADIHCVISGEEKIITAPVDAMTVSVPYSEEKDIVLGECKGGEEHIIRSGQYCVTMPEEAHSPGRCVSTPGRVRKAVFKVRVC